VLFRSLLIAHRSQEETESSLYERLLRQTRVDGLIVATMKDEKAETATLTDLGHPFVLVNRNADGVRHYVVPDDRGGAQKAVEYLASKGHRSIGHLAGQLHRYNAKCRLQGYKDGLEASGLPFDPRLVVEGGYSQTEGIECMRRMLQSDTPRPTAIFVVSLLAAAGAMSALRQAGLRVPEDMSVIAFNDAPIAEVLTPPLTTIRVPLEKMGQIAAETLINAIEGKDDVARITLPDTEIVERESVATVA